MDWRASKAARQPFVGLGRPRAAGFCAALCIAGLFMPKWLTFLITMAAANGLVSLGIVGLMRGGVVPFGQGMMLALGGYAAALSFNHLGITDILLLTLAAGRWPHWWPRPSRRCCRATAASSSPC
jgi:ABC-type branched-subunit amino acid transport system permease subunit